MGSLTNIFSGPAQVSLWDDTNKELFLGYHEIVEFDEKDIGHKLIDGNMLQYGQLSKIEIPILESDPELLANIRARRSTKQTIYVVGMEGLLQIDNVYITILQNRIFKGGEFHKLVASAQTEVEDDVNFKVNLLGTDGNCNTEVGSTGLATGWAESSTALVDVGVSHLPGRGNQQEVEFTGGGSGVLYYDFICPLEFPAKVTVSAYVDDYDASGSAFDFGIKTKTNAGVVVDSNMTGQVLDPAEQTRITKEVNLVPGANVAKISVYFAEDGSDSAAIGIDDVQLEFGALTDFTENE